MLFMMLKNFMKGNNPVCPSGEQYRMEFDEFKKKRIFESSGRSYEVERDYCDWELAIDGIQTVSAELMKLARYI
jgi:hypothetical protein